MAKDPAFLFYSSDFLNGISDLTMEERGQYITMLCLQHQKGALSEKTIRLSVGSVSVDVLSKFQKNEIGEFFNTRLNSEIDKRTNFVDSRRNNGALGGRPKKDIKPIGYPNGKAKHKPKPKLHEDEIENEIKDINDIELKGKLKELFLTEKWIGKNISAIKATVKKCLTFEKEFIIELIDKAIIGEYQGLFFSNTKQDYQNYLKLKQTSPTKQVSSYGPAK